jgi:branched-chain amino acid transport system substrate-binding protein
MLALLVVAMAVAGCAPSAPPAPEVKEPIKIAVVGPLTGDAANYGHWVERGTFLAMTEINKAGGVDGRELELVYYDDLCQPSEAVLAAHRIATDESIFAVIGHVCSSCCLATQQIFEDAGLTHITPSCTNPTICDRGFAYQFRTITHDGHQGPLMAAHAIETLGLKKVAIIYGAEDYATGLYESTAPAVTELGGELVAVESFTPGDKDFSAQLTKIAEADPDALLPFGHYSECALITKQRVAAGMEDVVVIQPAGSQQPGFLEIAGDAAEGGYILVYYDPFHPRPENKQFVSAYEGFFAGETPSENAAYSYEVVYMIKQAIEKGATKETLHEVMHNVTFTGPTGETKFAANGDVSEKPQAVLVIEGGEMVSWVP